MALPSSGNPISILDLAREKVYDDYDDPRKPLGSLYNSAGVNKFPFPLDGKSWEDGKGGRNMVLTRDTGQGIGVAGSGNSSLKMACDGGSDPYTYTYAGNDDYDNIVAATTGNTWTFSCYAKTTNGTTTTGQLFIFEADDNGGYLAHTSNTIFTITDEWQRFEVTRTMNSAACENVQVRLDGPNAGAIVNIWWDGFQVEEASSATALTMNGPFSLTDLVEGNDDEGSSVDWEATNTNSASEPDTSTPHAMSEWYDYDHDAAPAPSAQILLHSNGSDPGTTDSYSFSSEGVYGFSSVYRVVISNTAGSTNIVGNDGDFGLAAEGADVTPDNYAVSTSAKTIAVQYATFYFRVRRDIPAGIGSDTVTITVTPAGSGVQTDSIAITFNWNTLGGE